jgi:hypothetical protein
MTVTKPATKRTGEEKAVILFDPSELYLWHSLLNNEQEGIFILLPGTGCTITVIILLMSRWQLF